MFAQTAKIDPDGRLILPKPLLEASGIAPESEVMIEVTKAGIMIKPKQLDASITARISRMDLPVEDWEEMERTIDAGRIGS